MGVSHTKPLLIVGCSIVAAGAIAWFALRKMGDQTPRPRSDSNQYHTPVATPREKMSIENGVLSRYQVMRVINRIRTKAQKPLGELKYQSRQQRRIYMTTDFDEYRRLSSSYYLAQEQIIEFVTRQTYQEFSITETDFDNALNHFLGDNEVIGAVQNMTKLLPKYNVPTKSISKDHVLDICRYHMSMLDKVPHGDPLTANEFFIHSLKMSDEIFFKFGVEEEQIMEAAEILELEDHPELSKYEEKLLQFASIPIISGTEPGSFL